MDSTTTLSHESQPSRIPFSPESMEHMIQAATYGVQALDSATKRAALDLQRGPNDRSPDESDANGSKTRQVRTLAIGMWFQVSPSRASYTLAVGESTSHRGADLFRL